MTAPRIAIAMVSTTRTAEAACMFRWMQILLTQPGFVPHLFYASSTYTVQGRNAVSFDLLNNDPAGCPACPIPGSHIDMWDSVLLYDLDQIPPATLAPDNEPLFHHLQEIAPHYPVVAGLVHMRAYPFSPIAYDVPTWDGSVSPAHIPLARMRDYLKNRRIVKVDAVGTGAMLIRKDVLVRMAEFKAFPRHALWETPPRAPVDPLAPRKHWLLGEDLNFCREVGGLGFEIFLDTRFESGHVEDQVIGSKNYLMAAQAQEQQRQHEAARAIVEAQDRGQILLPPGVVVPAGRRSRSN